MSLRVSQIHLQVVLLDEYDAPRPTEAVTFSGDAKSGALQKAAEWLSDLPNLVRNIDPAPEE